MIKQNILRVLACFIIMCSILTLVCCTSSADVTTEGTLATETQEQSDDAQSTASTDIPTQDTTDQTTSESGVGQIQQTPIKNWDGAELSVLMSQDDRGQDIFFDSDIPAEQGKLIQDRNRAIEEKYGISLRKVTTSDLTKYVTSADYANAGSGIVYASGSGGMSELMLYGVLEDLYAYKDKTVTSAGVSVSVLRQLSVYDKLYMLTGAPIRSSVSSTNVLAYNKSALSKLGYEDGYLEQKVMDGKWTYDMMHQLLKEQSDLGLSGSEDMLYVLWQGMGAHTIDKELGDIPVVSVYSSRNIYYFELVHQLYDEQGKRATDITSLFCIDTIGNITQKLNSDTAILPLPSYHEGGEYTCVQNYEDTFFTAIPSGAGDKQLALDYLRGLYSESIGEVYADIVEDYDFENRDVLDIILKSRHFDFLDMYGIGHIMKTAFSPNSDTADFDKLLSQRAKFASQALDIALRQTVGGNIKG